jgi:WD40 repeat protein
VSEIVYSPDGEQVATAGDEGIVKIWNISTGELVRQTEKQEKLKIYSLAWSPDGAVLVFGGSDNAIYLWDIKTGASLGTLEGHTDAVVAMAWSPTSPLLVSAGGGDEGIIRFWDMENKQEVYQIKAPASKLEWSPDGRQLLLRDRTALRFGAGQKSKLPQAYTAWY